MQQERLSYLEKIIAGKQRDFYEIGKALTEIKQARLYRVSLYDSFENYVKARWDMGRSQAYRLIDAYQVISNLSPIGDKLPLNESQARPLAGLNSLEQRTAWKRFLATGKEMTASNIKAIVSSGKPSCKGEPLEVTDRITDAFMAAVSAMLEQVRVAQHDRWQATSRQTALLWNRVIREKILSKESDYE